MKRILLAAALATCAISALSADIAPSADGSFKSQNFTMPVSTAMAYRGRSIIDKTDVINEGGSWRVDDEMSDVVLQ
jgi:hypothetical protein